jgi:hypothetical protein
MFVDEVEELEELVENFGEEPIQPTSSSEVKPRYEFRININNWLWYYWLE